MRTWGRALETISPAFFVSVLLAAAACGKVEGGDDDGAIDAPIVDIDAPTDGPPAFLLTVMVGGNGTGTVTSAPSGINCGTDCIENYAPGTQVTLTAAPTGPSTFASWTGGGCSGTGTCAVTLNADTTITATFDARPNVFPDSATRSCTDGAINVTCPAGIAGQDGHYTINTPVYDSATDIVTDTLTGLVWERNPAYVAQPYAQNDSRCANLVLAGFSDWRLPTELELYSIIDSGRPGPGFPTVPFPGIPGNSFFVSATPHPVAAAAHFGIAVNYPVTYTLNDTSSYLSRCVRGTAFQGMLTASGASVVDSRTGLTWQSGIGTPGTWAASLAYCENLTLDSNSNWRAPTLKELASIVDYSRNSPAIATVFSARPNATFWSSTPVNQVPSSAFVIDFTSGNSFNIDTPQGQTHNIRCVR